jgi:hypothetical protein
VTSARPRGKPEEEEINLDIEKLLSEADEEEYEDELQLKRIGALVEDEALKCIGNNF